MKKWNPKFMAQVVTRDGKYFVWVYTPLVGKPDVQHPTTFDPDIQDEIGPFDSEEEANERLREIQNTLRQRGQLWEARNKKATKPKQRRKVRA